MTIYRLTTTHTFTANDAEDREFPTPRDAWEFARDDYAASDHGESPRSVRVNLAILDTASHGTAGTVRLTTGEVVTVTEGCECNEDDGPCESHMETVVMREGASMRSADELSALFVDDAVSIGAELSATGEAMQRELNDTASWEGSWLRDPDTADAMRDLTNQLESDIATLDDGPFYVRWDDGYVIYKITGGPLATDDDVCDDCRND